MIKICVSGSKGKMGLRILELAKADTNLQVAGQFDINEDPEPHVKECDVLIEFTSPKATIEHLGLCEKYKKAMVIGTTGLSDDEKAFIKTASGKIPVVLSSNMSIGVNTMFQIVGTTAKTLDSSYSARIKEAHHVHKKDSPSGTAKELARIIKEARPVADIPIEAIRENEIVGDHLVVFEGPVDRIEIFHSAKTRDIFVKGALEAVKFVAGKMPRLYTMQEVLGIAD